MTAYQRKRVRTLTNTWVHLLLHLDFVSIFPGIPSCDGAHSLHLLQAILVGVYLFILVLEIAYLLVYAGNTHIFDSQAVMSNRLFKSRAVFYSRLVLIALLASFIALMRCNPVGKEEEVRLSYVHAVPRAPPPVQLLFCASLCVTHVAEAHALRPV